MNKIYIATAMALTSIAFVGAQAGGANQTQGRPTATARPAGTQDDRPQITTLSGPVGEQIKALNKEMESKIQAIRDEYMAKIKAILESNKVVPSASTTAPGIMRGVRRGMDEGRKMGIPFMQGTGTRPMMGESDVREQSEGQRDAISRLRDLFRGFLGR